MRVVGEKRDYLREEEKSGERGDPQARYARHHSFSAIEFRESVTGAAFFPRTFQSVFITRPIKHKINKIETCALFVFFFLVALLFIRSSSLYFQSSGAVILVFSLDIILSSWSFNAATKQKKKNIYIIK